METIAIERDAGVATLTLTGKTMPPRFFDELGDACRDVAADPEIRAVVIRGGHERHFTVGLDLKLAFAEHGALFRGGLAAQRTQLLALIERYQASFTALAELRVPTIAAVHGLCLGGGIDLITACDIRYCTADAGFAVQETKIAIVADLGTLQRLPAIVGQGHARELILTGRKIDGARAEAVQLVSRVAKDKAALWNDAMATAREIAANPPLTVEGAKRVLNQAVRRDVASGLDYVAAWNSAFLASEDLGEAVSAFVAKRPPKFKGR